jgi:hypothetical protein
MSEKTVYIGSQNSIFYTIVAILTAIIGHEIHGSVFWSIVDFFFWPFAWLKWLILQEVNMTIIKEAFSFFLS